MSPQLRELAETDFFGKVASEYRFRPVAAEGRLTAFFLGSLSRANRDRDQPPRAERLVTCLSEELI
jgi:hypothetical protein